MEKTMTDAIGSIVTIRGLTVEVLLTGERPDAKELLNVEGHPEVFLEVNYFRGDKAVCLNLNNDSTVRCGQKVSRSHTKVTVPVGPATMGRVFNALGEPIRRLESPRTVALSQSRPEPRATVTHPSSNYSKPDSRSSIS